MRRLNILLLLTLVLAAPLSTAHGSFGSLSLLRDITCTGTGENPEIVLDLDDRAIVRLDYFKQSRYILLVLKGVYVKPAKRVFEGNGETVARITAVQFDPETVKVIVKIPEGVEVAKDTLRTISSGEYLFMKFSAFESQPVETEQTELVKTPVPEKKATKIAVKKEEHPAPAVTLQPAAVNVIPDAAADLTLDAEEPAEVIPSIKGEIDQDIKKKLDAVFSAENESEAGEIAEEEESPGFLVAGFKILASLFIVVGVLLLLAYLAKRYRLGDFRLKTGDDLIRVVTSKSIGVKRNVTLLDVAGEILVVAVSPSEIRLLTKLEDPSAVSRIQNEQGESVRFLSSFRDKLKDESAWSENEKVQPENFASPLTEIQKKLSNLKKL